MSPRGGRFQREYAPDRVRTVYDEILERAVDLINSAKRVLPRLPPIHFDFINNKEISAIAFKSNGRYFIGVNTGALYMLRMVIGRMLSDSHVFQSIGDFKEEEASLSPIAGYMPDADEMATTVGVPLTPKNTIRRAYAGFIQDQAIMFLVGHELSHITRGHVDYLNSKYGFSFNAEVGFWGRGGQERMIERQCLEQDADRRSIISRIDSLKVTFQNPHSPVCPWARSVEEPSQLILDWAISVNILFRLFGDVNFSRSKLNKDDYPPVPLRRAMCEAVAYWAIEHMWDPQLKSIAEKALVLGRSQTEYAFATILGQEISINGLQNAFSKEGSDHAVLLEDYWNENLFRQLKPFSYEKRDMN